MAGLAWPQLWRLHRWEVAPPRGPRDRQPTPALSRVHRRAALNLHCSTVLQPRHGCPPRGCNAGLSISLLQALCSVIDRTVPMPQGTNSDVDDAVAAARRAQKAFAATSLPSHQLIPLLTTSMTTCSSSAAAVSLVAGAVVASRHCVVGAGVGRPARPRACQAPVQCCAACAEACQVTHRHDTPTAMRHTHTHETHP